MKIEGIGLTDITNSVNRLQIQEDKTFEDTLKKAYSDGDKEKLKGVCKEYEGLLLQMMYKQMKRTIPESELLPASSGREIFQDMLDDELIDSATQRGIGISEVLYRQLSLNMDKTYVIDPGQDKKG
ncbi:MAG: flagellar biosynthesis protein FlgJ [Ruminiclostridium sp.]|nr:flagellar biosynthesis protein FlgJ [Ruminiclostridium sp.]